VHIDIARNESTLNQVSFEENENKKNKQNNGSVMISIHLLNFHVILLIRPTYEKTIDTPKLVLLMSWDFVRAVGYVGVWSHGITLH
jgi:hypothetical protein